MPSTILIFGAGATGTYLGASLSLQGHQVVFLEREKDLVPLSEQGLVVVEEDTQLRIHPAGFISSLAALDQYAFQWGVLALKTYHIQGIARQLSAHRMNLPPLLSIQNGIGSKQVLAGIIGEDHVIPGTLTTAVNRRQKGIVEVQKKRGLGIALTHPISRQIASTFADAGLKTSLYQDPQAMKWSKLLTNLMGNATSAILSLPPGEVYQHPGLYRLELAQLRETLAVMQAMGARPVNLPGVPVVALTWVIKYLPWQISQQILFRAVRGGRGGKMPSLHQDLVRKRGQSEVDDLNGAVVRAADRIGVPAPVNRKLLSTVRALISGNVTRQDFQSRPEALLARFDNLL